MDGVTTIDVPGVIETRVGGINNRGQIAIDAVDAQLVHHGLLFDQGRFTEIKTPRRRRQRLPCHRRRRPQSRARLRALTNTTMQRVTATLPPARRADAGHLTVAILDRVAAPLALILQSRPGTPHRGFERPPF